MGERLTPAQRRLLKQLADGGRFFAALRWSDDFSHDGIVFSERVGITVHPTTDRATWYRVRNRTAGPLFLAAPPLVNCFPESSGLREFNITDAGRAALEASHG